MADGLLNQLAAQGILGLIAALAIVGMVSAIMMLLKEKDRRIEDAVKTRDSVAEPLNYIKESLDLISQKIRISKENERQ